MKMNQVPNLRVEDFPSESTWIGRLFIQLNPFIQSVNQVFENDVDFSTNIKSLTRDFDITTFQEFSFTWPFTGTSPVDLRVVKALKGSAQSPTILLASWKFDSTNDLITVTRLVEVTDVGVAQLSGRYRFSIRVTV